MMFDLILDDPLQISMLHPPLGFQVARPLVLRALQLESVKGPVQQSEAYRR